jgi:hypothetical protein
LRGSRRAHGCRLPWPAATRYLLPWRLTSSSALHRASGTTELTARRTGCPARGSPSSLPVPASPPALTTTTTDRYGFLDRYGFGAIPSCHAAYITINRARNHRWLPGARSLSALPASRAGYPDRPFLLVIIKVDFAAFCVITNTSWWKWRSSPFSNESSRTRT